MQQACGEVGRPAQSLLRHKNVQHNVCLYIPCASHANYPPIADCHTTLLTSKLPPLTNLADQIKTIFVDKTNLQIGRTLKGRGHLSPPNILIFIKFYYQLFYIKTSKHLGASLVNSLTELL